MKHTLGAWNAKCIFKKQKLLPLGVSGWERQAIDAKMPMICALNPWCDHLLTFKVPHLVLKQYCPMLRIARNNDQENVTEKMNER